ncbi:MAG: hypothetical protein E2O39_02620 [Planctomycetota bacterium]|nr:MAG: hypothetical protein E2O39_02620 [Planctomycetota bacterium]
MLRHALVPIAAAALLLGPPAAPQQGGGTDIFGRTRPVDEVRLARKEPFMGAWRLVQMVDHELPANGRSEEGFLLFSPGYMALQWHVMWDTVGGTGVEDDFASGIHSWDIDSLGNLTTNIMIGAFLDEEEILEYEQPGAGWTFQARITGGMLTLTRSDGSRMTFVRHLGLGPGAGRDIFGRTARDDETVDIFGRKVKSGDEDTSDERDGDGR